MHGYDNVVESMHAIFMANGPAFKINHKIDPFDSVELYQLFGQLLNVRPRDMPPTNGSAKYDGLHILRPKNPFCFQGMGSFNRTHGTMYLNLHLFEFNIQTHYWWTTIYSH